MIAKISRPEPTGSVASPTAKPVTGEHEPRGSAQSGFYEVAGDASPTLIAYDLTENPPDSRWESGTYRE
jgi:hypothetical protein